MPALHVAWRSAGPQDNSPVLSQGKAGPLAGNHFATVVEGVERLPELGRTALWEGAQPIRFDEK